MIYHIALLFNVADFVYMNASGSCTALGRLWMSPSLNKAGSLLCRRESRIWTLHCVSQELVILWEDEMFLSFFPAFSALLHISICHVHTLCDLGKKGRHYLPPKLSPQIWSARENPGIHMVLWNFSAYLPQCVHYTGNCLGLWSLTSTLELRRLREPFLIG